ncbi:hypothetical protein [Pseudaquabacterium pictum]|uniref:SPOR domain-containing protein n=1 Tax=Pseudaquabacterium pictum TaxID=2315236 RepID=A0A480AR54_9BURK|nr:hypothetical protein [Rubrivivax pictus]GCL63320.1 hypothetical protein AQPW35_24010 [Rubrivivax pictus]
MKAPRLHELTARVVAWHNRHPLARRIDASQVHSIGEVVLPFASAQPLAGAPVAPAPAAPPAPVPAGGPTLAEALAQRQQRLQPAAAPEAGPIDGLDVQSMLPEDHADLFAAAQAGAETGGEAATAGAPAPLDDAEDGEAALVIPLLDGDAVADADAPADLAADTPAEGDGPAATEAAEAAAPITAQAIPEADASLAEAHAAEPTPPPGAALPVLHDVAPAAVYPPPHGSVPESALARAVARRAAAHQAAGGALPLPDDLPAPPAGSRWQRLVAAVRRLLTGRQPGLPPLRAAFSREFIWPLRPGRVARWAQRHGQPQPLAPADWPQRRIDADRTRLTALRGKGLAHDLPLHVLTAAIGVGDRRIRVLVGADGSILGPRAYSRARLGSVGLVAAVALVGLGWTLRPLHGGPSGDDAAALAAAPASAASAPLAAASAPPVAAASAAASAALLADAASAAEPPASAASSATDGATMLAAAPPEAAASQPQADIRPALSDEERYLARVEAARLRGEPPPDPPATLLPGPVYAVVGPASRQRATAAGSLALMKAAAGRMDGSAPGHGELLESQGLWRAAWWPFTSLVDAERARVLLAGKGVKAEVVEF